MDGFGVTDQIARRKATGSRGGQPPTFDGLATRYAKRAACYQAGLTIAAIVLWLR